MAEKATEEVAVEEALVDTPDGVWYEEVENHSPADAPRPDEEALTDEQKEHLKENGLL